MINKETYRAMQCAGPCCPSWWRNQQRLLEPRAPSRCRRDRLWTPGAVRSTHSVINTHKHKHKKREKGELIPSVCLTDSLVTLDPDVNSQLQATTEQVGVTLSLYLHSFVVSIPRHFLPFLSPTRLCSRADVAVVCSTHDYTNTADYQ